MSSRRSLDFLFPGDPRTLTGGYIYDRRVIEGLAGLGWQVTARSLNPSFPFPTNAALDDAEAILASLPSGRIVVIDGLALGGMADLVQREASRLRLVALIHHPLAFETGLEPRYRRTLEESERRCLAAVRTAIVTSRWTMQTLGSYGVPEERIRVVMPGTDRAPVARGSEGSSPSLLCVATLTPRKGHAVLFDALGRLRDRPWQLWCVGSLTRDRNTVESLRRQIERLELGERITLLGEIGEEALARRYDRADLFVLASYLEGYGMALTEALSRGLPLVTTSAGAVTETVPEEAALFVPVGDGDALTEALASVLDEPRKRAELASGARIARDRLPTWERACAEFAAVLGVLR